VDEKVSEFFEKHQKDAGLYWGEQAYVVVGFR